VGEGFLARKLIKITLSINLPELKSTALGVSTPGILISKISAKVCLSLNSKKFPGPFDKQKETCENK
jgi:hypothetical protein